MDKKLLTCLASVAVLLIGMAFVGCSDDSNRIVSSGQEADGLHIDLGYDGNPADHPFADDSEYFEDDASGGADGDDSGGIDLSLGDDSSSDDNGDLDHKDPPSMDDNDSPEPDSDDRNPFAGD